MWLVAFAHLCIVRKATGIDQHGVMRLDAPYTVTLTNRYAHHPALFHDQLLDRRVGPDRQLFAQCDLQHAPLNGCTAAQNVLTTQLLLEHAPAQLHGLALARPGSLEQEQCWELVGIGRDRRATVARQTPFPFTQLSNIEQLGHQRASTWLTARAVIVVIAPTIGVLERHALALKKVDDQRAHV
ncbi:hypothetical protein D3C75_517310 [compost metagenome]